MSFQSLKKELESKMVTLVAVSKTYPPDRIKSIFDQGQRDFGENKVQELVAKHEVLPKEIRWHLIGHLQSNKVKNVAPFVYMIHSVDTLKLAKEINKQATKSDRVINCLLQLKVAQEESKFGISMSDLNEFMDQLQSSKMTNIQWRGIMGMASFTDDHDQVRSEFVKLGNCFKKLKSQYFSHSPKFDTLSMGMSGDYEIAISEGSNMVRIGSLIFGERR